LVISSYVITKLVVNLLPVYVVMPKSSFGKHYLHHCVVTIVVQPLGGVDNIAYNYGVRTFSNFVCLLTETLLVSIIYSILECRFHFYINKYVVFLVSLLSYDFWLEFSPLLQLC
jgi:hypothetical protein